MPCKLEGARGKWKRLLPGGHGCLTLSRVDRLGNLLAELRSQLRLVVIKIHLRGSPALKKVNNTLSFCRKVLNARGKVFIRSVLPSGIKQSAKGNSAVSLSAKDPEMNAVVTSAVARQKRDALLCSGGQSSVQWHRTMMMNVMHDDDDDDEQKK